MVNMSDGGEGRGPIGHNTYGVGGDQSLTFWGPTDTSYGRSMTDSIL